MVKEVKWTKYLWLSLLSFGAFMLEYLSIFVIEVIFLHVDIQNYITHQRNIHCIIMVFMWACFIGVLLLLNNGDLAGMKHELANEKYPCLYWSSLAYDECYPNGESPKMFYNRIKTTWLELKNRILKQPLKSSMIVTHQGVIEVILCVENSIAFSNKTFFCAECTVNTD